MTTAEARRRAADLRTDAVALLDELLDLVDDPPARRALDELLTSGGWDCRGIRLRGRVRRRPAFRAPMAWE